MDVLTYVLAFVYIVWVIRDANMISKLIKRVSKLEALKEKEEMDKLLLLEQVDSNLSHSNLAKDAYDGLTIRCYSREDFKYVSDSIKIDCFEELTLPDSCFPLHMGADSFVDVSCSGEFFSISTHPYGSEHTTTKNTLLTTNKFRALRRFVSNGRISFDKYTLELKAYKKAVEEYDNLIFI